MIRPAVLHSIILKQGQLHNQRTTERVREMKSATGSKWPVITAQYLGQRCCSLFGPSPHRGPWESSGRPPGGLSHSGPCSKTPSPPILAGSLENRPLLSPGSTPEELRAPPPTSAAGLCFFFLTRSRRPQTQKHKHFFSFSGLNVWLLLTF